MNRHQPVAEDDCWTARQIAHSYDYSVHNPRERELVAMLTAGLNMQSLHHAIPTVAQSRLAGLYEEYAEIAARHGAAPRTSRNILTASRELLEYLFENNAPVRAAEAVPVARRTALGLCAGPRIAARAGASERRGGYARRESTASACKTLAKPAASATAAGAKWGQAGASSAGRPACRNTTPLPRSTRCAR